MCLYELITNGVGLIRFSLVANAKYYNMMVLNNCVANCDMQSIKQSAQHLMLVAYLKCHSICTCTHMYNIYIYIIHIYLCACVFVCVHIASLCINNQLHPALHVCHVCAPMCCASNNNKQTKHALAN